MARETFVTLVNFKSFVIIGSIGGAQAGVFISVGHVTKGEKVHQGRKAFLPATGVTKLPDRKSYPSDWFRRCGVPPLLD
jgi:hypothetical protein